MTPELTAIRAEIETVRRQIATLRNQTEREAIELRWQLVEQLGRLYDREAILFVSALDSQEAAPRVRKATYRRSS